MPVMALWEAFQAWIKPSGALTQDKRSPAREGQMLLPLCQNDTAALLKVAANRSSVHAFEAEHDITWMLCDAQQLFLSGVLCGQLQSHLNAVL